jgi:hypothetical protein
MEKQSTEYDILIAKFAGWKIDNNFPDKNKVWRSPKGNVEFESTFKFSSDWNDLHQVINKIEALTFREHNYNVHISKNKSVIQVTHYKTGSNLGFTKYIHVNDYPNSTKLERTYAIIIEFIKWFNEQQKL